MGGIFAVAGWLSWSGEEYNDLSVLSFYSCILL